MHSGFHKIWIVLQFLLDHDPACCHQEISYGLYMPTTVLIVVPTLATAEASTDIKLR
jgi:hypothetical protein